MNEHWRNVKVNVISFADVGTVPPLSCALQREEARRSGSRTIDANLAALCVGKPSDFLQRIRITKKGVIYESEFTGKLHPLITCIDPNYLVYSESFSQHRRRQSNRTQSSHQHSVPAADAHTCERFPSGAEPTRDQCPVYVRQVVRQSNTRTLFGQQIWRVPSITLPSISRSILVLAGDHVTRLAIVTDATAADVVQDYSVSNFELLATRPGLNDLPAWFVTRDRPGLVTFRALAKMGSINCSNVAPAD